MNPLAPIHGVIAILRGVTPDEVVDLGHALCDAGVATLEVPLNSPQPFESLRRLHHALGGRARVGAGTVMGPDDVDRAAEAGATLVLSPHFDAAVVRRTVARGLFAMPGVATPSEGVAALAAGAHALKLFPAEMLGPPVLKAWRAVFAPGTALVPVGGIGVDNLAAFKAAGAAAVGVGSSLYAPGVGVDAVAERARALVAAWDGAAA
jgi:2-dehydro-3-deoxyphosphogalactonate aldolase